MIMNTITEKIPINDRRKNRSAIFSYFIPFLVSSVLMEINDNTDEIVKNKATTEVNSSIRKFCAWLVRCSEVIMTRQKPSRFAEELRMCCEVLFAMSRSVFNHKKTTFLTEIFVKGNHF